MEQSGQFQGRLLPEALPESERDATKLEQLEVNITMIQLKMFIDHSETILRQASSLNISLCDCVVEFDLRGCPPILKTLSYNEVFRTPGAKRAFEDGRSKENITCMYNSNFYNGEVPRPQPPRGTFKMGAPPRKGCGAAPDFKFRSRPKTA